MKKACTECNRSGFTLIELLVVVAVIAILSLIGLTIFSAAQTNARDARRKADVDAIAKAIEINKTPGSIYYTQLPALGFSSSKVPIESFVGYVPKYCIKFSTIETSPANPTNWGATTIGNCPSGTAPNDNWIEIPADGIPSGAVTFGATADIGKILSWKVCARLEASGAAITGATLKIFCYPSSQ